jgi:hypothetical protein
MIIGIGDFRGGETRRARVNPDEPRRLKWCGGWDTSRGHLSPDSLPALRGTEGGPNGYAGGKPPAQVPFCFRGAVDSYVVYRDYYGRLHMVDGNGDWRFCGRKKSCWYEQDTYVINCDSHGFLHGDRVRFLDVIDTPGFGMQQDWWVLSDPTEDTFRISLAHDGDALLITETGSCSLHGYPGDALGVIADGGPCRIDDLLVFPTDGASAALVTFEPAGEDSGGNALTKRVRPLGLRGPTDYRGTEAPTVTPHSPHPATQLFDLTAAETDNPDSHFEVAPGSFGVTHYPAADYEELRLSKACIADQLCAKYDLGEMGVAITHQVYLNLDLKLTYTGDDPNARMSITGQFINTDQTVLSSGFEFVLYSDQICTTETEMRRYAIPRIGSDGRIYRFMVHLGDLSQDCTVTSGNANIACTGHGYSNGDTVAVGRTVGTGAGQLAAGTVYFVCGKADDTFQLEGSVGGGAITPNGGGANTVARAVRGLGIRTAPGWIPPQEMDLGGGVTTSGEDRLWLHSGDFDATGNWKCMGNYLLPAVTFADSPWAIPAEPSKGQAPGRNRFQDWVIRIAAGAASFSVGDLRASILAAINRLPVSPGETGTSATLLEVFPDSYESFSPARPKVRYAYCFRGRDQLSTEQYRVMISNPSAASGEVFADPWRTESVDIELPDNSSGLDAGDEYGAYLTHVLVYRSIFIGFTEAAGGEIGVWTDWHYRGYLRVVNGAVTSGYGYFKDCQRREVDCELSDTTEIITNGSVASPTAHGLQPGDALAFGNTTGGVAEGTTYYVVSCPDLNRFVISPRPDGNPRECTMNADTDTVACLSHGFSVDDPILFTGTGGEVTAGQVYYVSAAPTEHTFTIKDSEGDPVMWAEDAGNVVCTVLNITAAGANTWSSAPAEPTVAGYPVPEMMEANHDYPSAARYVISGDGRIYALCLSWTGDEESGHWSRPKDLEISNWQDYGSFPTTTSDPPEESEGEELTDYAPNSYNGKGLLARQQSKFVFMDNAFYELVGADPIQGWDFLRRDSVGCRDARTITDCRSELIWHDGTDFYSYGGGLCEPISKGLVDSSRIHWDQPFGAAFARDQYVFFCHHDDPDADTPYCLMIFDLQTRAWRRRYSASYQLAGICAAEDGSTVYGVMCGDDHLGEVVDLFSDTTGYGGAQTYDVWTQYLVIAPPGEERHVSNAVLEVVTDQGPFDLAVDLYSQGRMNDSKTGVTLTVYDHQSIYGAPELNCDLTGDAVAVRVRYSGDYPPDIHFIGVNVDDAVAG